MPREKLVTLNMINIAMNPSHSPQKYYEFFKSIFDKKLVAKIAGEKYGTLSTLTYIDKNDPLKGMYGFFYKYTKIQLDRWFNLLEEKFISNEELKSIRIPKHIVPNAEKFSYVFFPKKHRIIFQSSESGKRFSPRLASKMFEEFFNDERITNNEIFTSVTLEQSEKSLSNIYSIPILSKMDIIINRPNADFDDQDEKEVFKRMESQNVRRWQTILRAPIKQNITPDNETKILATVALSNGKVDAIGYDEEGMKIEESTTKYPLVEKYTYDPEKDDFISQFLIKAKEFLTSFLG